MRLAIESDHQPTIAQGRGLRINNALVEDAAAQIADADLIDGRYLLVAMGKKLRAVLELV